MPTLSIVYESALLTRLVNCAFRKVDFGSNVTPVSMLEIGLTAPVEDTTLVVESWNTPVRNFPTWGLAPVIVTPFWVRICSMGSIVTAKDPD
jgi:hypothetical protein